MSLPESPTSRNLHHLHTLQHHCSLLHCCTPQNVCSSHDRSLKNTNTTKQTSLLYICVFFFSTRTLSFNVHRVANKQEAQKLKKPKKQNVPRLYCSCAPMTISPPSCSSVRLLGPGQVVRPRPLSGESLDQLLHPPPEAQQVQGVVAPTCGGRETHGKKEKK